MTTLTPKQIAQGWKPIAEIVNEDDDAIIQHGIILPNNLLRAENWRSNHDAKT